MKLPHFAYTRMCVELMAALLFVIISPASSFAITYTEDPPSTMTQRVHDTSGVLKNLDDLDMYARERSNQLVDLYAVFAKTFDAKAPLQWCKETLHNSARSSHSMYLVIAVNDRKYALCYRDGITLNSTQENAIKDPVENLLAQDNWNKAVLTYLDIAPDIVEGTHTGTHRPLEGDGLLSGVSIALLVFLLISVPVAIGAVLLFSRSRQKAWATHKITFDDGRTVYMNPQSQQYHDHVTQRINKAGEWTMKADNAVRAAKEDAQFASLEFGASDSQRFHDALELAEQASTDAFDWFHRVEDEPDWKKKETYANNAIKAAKAAIARIEDEESVFQEKRKAKNEAGQMLHRAQHYAQELETKTKQASIELDSLRDAFQHHELDSIADNPERAQRLIDNAHRTIADGIKAWDDGDHRQAADLLELSQRTLTQASMIIDSVMNAREHLSHIRQTLLQAMSSISADLEDVSTLAPNDRRFDAYVHEARQAISQAEKANDGQGDPLAALERLTIAENTLDTELEPLREQAVTDQKKQTRIAQLRSQVTLEIQQANSYISANRGAVGSHARMSIANAQLSVEAADKSDNLDYALQQLNEARSQARIALSQARDDVQRYHWNPNDRPPYGGGTTYGGSGIDIGSLVLGGLLFGGRGGGSSSWGGFGSSSGGFSGGFGGGSSGSFGNSGFGGGSSGSF
ncbi:MAG: hypothetical protein Q4P66_05000 [Actinomycetaceae bacterium]|nr:hypothetical protein [Actinomycetaceae bacterium]MDO5746999.1 hypothetical protein [Actinomycetaceae bacterium]